ncbi:predicted protein [Lichtheimia corymbifera JMRC:FSU:9682]|uniref:Uncharacterized protein n=1 Tax=Lichtheimia corymbifera JMRC:FSU:9682 TaxID=1263082 RepID=A0A068RKM2_9FUNG|nr:predicted protein [Lichtheimia corymbifera JMRC:FSU:9682]
MSDDDALWQPRQKGSDTTTIPAHQVPRWQSIQTPSEEREAQNSIRVLEAKLARVQARHVPQVHVDPNDDDDDDDMDESSDGCSQEQDQEGLHLLWKKGDLDNALRHRKVEEQYTWHWILAYIPRWCSCCFIPRNTT